MRYQLLGFVVFIAVAASSILAHETGHFLAARALGVAVSEFSIGLGPEITGFTDGETEYYLRAIPLGGYCRIENLPAESLLTRAVVLLAGVFGNLLFAIFLISIAKAFDAKKERYRVTVSATPILRIPAFFISGFLETVVILIRVIKSPRDAFRDWEGLGSIFQSAVSVTRKAVLERNFAEIVLYAFALNLSVMLLNLLPIPGALDGGKLLFVAIEAVFGKMDGGVASIVNLAGTLFIFWLVLDANLKDLKGVFGRKKEKES